MMHIRSVKDAEMQGKRVLLRVDFNVPLKDGVVADDTRIKAALPTIKLLQEKGAAHITLVTHMGRPGGKVVEELRVAPIAKRLKELLGVEVKLDEMISPDLASLAPSASDQSLVEQDPASYRIAQNIILLENIRFEAGEESNDPTLAQKLAALGDVFVNDAFADSHRAHASIVGVAKLLPSYAGLLMEEEVAQLSQALLPPQGALAIIGGAKFETKQPLIEKLLSLYSKLLLGGALGSDVLKSRGMPVGASLVSPHPVPAAIAGNDRLLVPVDVYMQEKDVSAERMSFVSDIRATERIVDIGTATAVQWADEIEKAPFVLWNGPMGVYEDGFTAGTDALAQALVQSKVKAVVGGGDTAAAVARHAFDSSRVFVSTGGGAMLQFLTDGTLPGIDVLRD